MFTRHSTLVPYASLVRSRTHGPNIVVLMRGHGFTAASRSLIEVLRIAIYLPRNARVQTAALALGGDIRWLRDGEIAAREAKSYGAGSVAPHGAWHSWSNRWRCSALLAGLSGV